MTEIMRSVWRALAFLAVQVLLLDSIPPLHRFLTPSIYLLFLLWLPLRVGQLQLLFLSFVYGSVMDMFSHTPGLHASACIWVAFARPGLIQLLMPRQEEDAIRVEPSLLSMGLVPYATYLLLLTLLHHGWVVFLEWLDLGDLVYFFIKVLATTLLSLLMMAVTELAFRRDPADDRR
ncbi:MAG: rod shape-determining protein MreD [Bacteroidetes bacterium]|nr:rod shape-determining protein MreD [Bacteroidota bacterium]